MRDPYEVLGVSRGATAAEIKSAYRRLAKRLHPDANKHDPKAAGRFAELNAAYEIVGDESKRKAFDRGEIDAEGKPRFRGFEGFGAGAGPGQSRGFEGFSFGEGGFSRGPGGPQGFGGAGIDEVLKNFFSGMSGAQGRRRTTPPPFEPEDFGSALNRDVTAAVTITLMEAAEGARKRVHLPTGKEVEVKIPPGLTEGQQIRLRGQGQPGPGRTSGDALVTVSIAPHPIFSLDGSDLRLDLPITPYEAVLGAKVRVPTLDGAVELTLPAGTAAGRTFRLKGKGLPTRDGKGDLLATVHIVLPDQADPEIVEFMRTWRDKKAYDPRTDLG